MPTGFKLGLNWVDKNELCDTESGFCQPGLNWVDKKSTGFELGLNWVDKKSTGFKLGLNWVDENKLQNGRAQPTIAKFQQFTFQPGLFQPGLNRV